MKATGIVRKVDNLGRIALPADLRKTLKIKAKDPMEIFMDGDLIILQEYEPVCIFCGQVKDITKFKGKLICKDCLNDIAQLRYRAE